MVVKKESKKVVAKKKAKKKVVRKHRQPKKKAAVKKKVTKKKVVKKKKLPKGILETDINSPEFKEVFESLDPSLFGEAIETLKKYIENDMPTPESEPEVEELESMPRSKISRNLHNIASTAKPPSFTPKHELDDKFYEELSKQVHGCYLGDENILSVLGEETFANIEKQMADTYLGSLQCNRRMRVLNQLLSASYELVEGNIGSILKGEHDDQTDD